MVVYCPLCSASGDLVIYLSSIDFLLSYRCLNCFAIFHLSNKILPSLSTKLPFSLPTSVTARMCSNCSSPRLQSKGFNRTGKRRFSCIDCGKHHVVSLTHPWSTSIESEGLRVTKHRC